MPAQKRTNNKNSQGSEKNESDQYDKQSKKNGGKPYIGPRTEAPAYVQDSKEILYGYRINYTNTKDVFRSLFVMHNETVNIWTHYFGFFVFVVLFGYVITHLAPNSFHSYPERDLVSRWTADVDSSLSQSRKLFDDYF